MTNKKQLCNFGEKGTKKSNFDDFYNYSMGEKRFFVVYEKEIVQSVIASLMVALLLLVFEMISYFLKPNISDFFIILIKIGLVFIFITVYINYVQWLRFKNQTPANPNQRTKVINQIKY
ncbi:MAG: hypothetical protein PHH82_01755 [Candidatus ainarchaeum sp.]|nr:hypothetical protein [Candidatus ainarchaeum sp.]